MIVGEKKQIRDSIDFLQKINVNVNTNVNSLKPFELAQRREKYISMFQKKNKQTNNSNEYCY